MLDPQAVHFSHELYFPPSWSHIGIGNANQWLRGPNLEGFTVAGFTFGDLFQIHLAKASEKVNEGQTWAQMTPKTCGTATISCAENVQSDVWQLHNIRVPSFFLLGSSARCIVVQVQRYAIEHSVVKSRREVEFTGVTCFDMTWMVAEDQLQEHFLTLQPVTAGKSRFKLQLFEVVFPEALRQKRL